MPNNLYQSVMDVVFKDDCTLSANNRLLMIMLARYMDESGTCSPSYDELAKATSLSRPTLVKGIKALISEGYISCKTAARANNTYQLSVKILSIE